MSKDVRLIDADAFIVELNNTSLILALGDDNLGAKYATITSQAVELYAGQNAIDAVPVVHGRWVKAHGMMPPEYHHRKQCSMCGGWALQDYFGRERMSHYCPNCGAKMDGGAEGV